MPQGNIFIVSAPSGAGKTTLVQGALARDPHLSLSVSYTTRAARPGEVDGQDYHFVDRTTFLSMLEASDFLESAEIYGNYYGTSQSWIEGQRRLGRDILLEIDWQGAQQVRRIFPEAISIYILPPSLQTLEARLTSRAKDSPEAIARRMASAKVEVQHVDEYDYIVVNHELDAALLDLCAIFRAERLREVVQSERHHDLILAMKS